MVDETRISLFQWGECQSNGCSLANTSAVKIKKSDEAPGSKSLLSTKLRCNMRLMDVPVNYNIYNSMIRVD